MKTTTFVSKPSTGKRYQPSLRHRAASRAGGKATATEPLARLKSLVPGLLGTGKGLGISFVYQDEETRQWAKAICRSIAKLAGDEGVRPSWWRIQDLSTPGILAGAVSTAVRADLVVVAARSEGLPLPFYVWVNMWWPHKSQSPGALLALIGTSAEFVSRGGRVGDYLREVSQQARMDFLILERALTIPVNGQIAPTNHNFKPLNGDARNVSETPALTWTAEPKPDLQRGN